MAERTKNIGQALLGGLSAGAGYMAQNHGQAAQQKNDNTLAAMTMMLQQQQAQRAQIEHAQKIALGRVNMQNANEQLKKVMFESSLTPEQIGERRAAEQVAYNAKYIQGIAPVMSELPKAPSGYEYDVQGFKQQQIGSAPGSKQPSFQDQILMKHLGESGYAEYLVKKNTIAKSNPAEQARMYGEYVDLAQGNIDAKIKFVQSQIDRISMFGGTDEEKRAKTMELEANIQNLWKERGELQSMFGNILGIGSAPGGNTGGGTLTLEEQAELDELERLEGNK